MAETQAWTGFPPDQALWRLRVAKGSEEGFQAFKDAHWIGAVPGTQAPESMVEILEAEGIQARAALLETQELCFLELPTLVELQDATWVLLKRFHQERFQVETPGGERSWALADFQGRITGRALDLSPALPPGSTLWARLKALFLQRRQALLQAGAATLLLQLLALATPAITAIVMDRALPDGARSLLWIVVVGMLLATLHQVWLAWIRDRILLFLGTRVMVSAERGFLEHALRCPFPFLQAKTLGELMQAFGGFTAARDLLPLKSVGVFLNGSLAFVYLGMMFYLLPGPTLIIVLSTGLLALVTLVVGRLEAVLQARQVEAQAREHGLLIELVAGISTLKGAGAEGKGLARWQGSFRKVLLLELARGRINLWASLGTGLLSQALAVILLIWGGQHLLEGTLKAGRLFAYLQLSAGFTGAVLSVVETFITLMILKPQLAKAQEILAMEPEPRVRPQTAVADSVAVVMEDVWFRYGPSSPWVLQGYNLRVEAGGKHTLSEPSGFGKTTVLRLLAGLHAPTRGTVLVNGRNPAEERHNLLYLPQFMQLFAGSILENLRVFSSGAALEKLMETSARTGLQALVGTLPMGYQTLIPPGGGNLSGGQRQLIALTGALASGRPLLLLDEALANLDSVHGAPLQGLIDRGLWTVVAANHSPLRSPDLASNGR